MCTIHYANIIRAEYPTLLMELCELGCLLRYLQDCRPPNRCFDNLVDTDGDMVMMTDRGSVRVSANTAVSETRLDSEENVSTTDLISFSYQISRGLEYLASRFIIHRDIAARNILVSKYKIAKVADFGMARWSEVDYLTSNASRASTFMLQHTFLNVCQLSRRGFHCRFIFQ
ncbi:hypothetical protein RvY_17721 [Ramazzottius varieornatus]|uniref:Protein kinase domain-containing protein n=1 Tax=Ramazzottius varieornatus TaxID=947166 RepID=A0A1D1W6W1_RAMVA|nr:hypothetical protein RvY_17721 [Ramazzottius varieornatus]